MSLFTFVMNIFIPKHLGTGDSGITSSIYIFYT
jgi:hypothetical protein